MNTKNNLSLWCYPSYVITIIIINLLQVVIIGISTQLFQKTVDQIENAGGKRVLLGAGFYIVLELVILIINYFYEIVQYRILQRMGNTVRERLFESVLSHRTTSERRKKKDYYVSMLVQDMKRYANDYLINQFSLVSLLLRLGTFSLLLFMYHWVLGAVSLLCMLLVYWSTNWHDNKMDIFSERKMKQDENYLKKYSDEIEGFSEYKHAGKEKLFLNRLKKANFEIEEEQYLYQKNMNQIFVVESLIKKGANVVAIALAFYLGLKGKISVGVILASYSLFSMIWDDIGAMLPVLQSIRAVDPILNKLKSEIIQTDIIEQEIAEIGEFQQLCLKNISFAYPQQRKVLHNVTLTLERGKKYALMGASGSGKSTLLRILFGMEKNYEGVIIADGKRVSQEHGALLKFAIYITQDVYLFQDSIKNNVFFGNVEYEENLKKTGYYKFLLEQFGNLEKNLVNDGGNISGGQRQMIAVARAIASGKKFFVFDESFSAIDEATFLNIWNELNALEDITCVMVTHRLKQAEVNCHVLCMDEIGGVVEC